MGGKTMISFRLVTIILLLQLSSTGFSQNRKLEIDLIEGRIDFSFGMVTTEKLRDKSTLLLYAPDSLSPFSVILLDSNLNVVTIGDYAIDSFPTPTRRASEDLDTGERTYFDYLAYKGRRSGTWLFFNRDGDIYKKEEY